MKYNIENYPTAESLRSLDELKKLGAFFVKFFSEYINK